MTAFLTNKGAEDGVILPWVATSGTAGAFSVSTDLPRSGANSFRFSPGGTGGGLGVTVTHTITDTDLVAAMVGQVVNFVVWVAIENLFFGGGHSGSNYRFRVRDDVGNGDWVNMFSGASPIGEVDNTYRQFVATRTIDASATVISLDLAYFKAGTRSAYKFYNDDLEMQVGGVAGEPDGGVGGIRVFPSQAITRVTNMIHRYVRANGLFILELQLGEVTTDFGIPQWLSAPQPAVAKTKADEFKTIEEAIDSALKDERVVIPSPRPLPRDTDLPPIEKPGQIPKREPKETLPQLPRPFPELPPIEKPSEFPKEIDRGGQVPRLTDEPVITKPGRIRKGTSGKASKRR